MARGKISSASRAEDEAALAILAGLSAGQTMAQVAGRHGISRSTVAGLVKRIRDADLAQSGEPSHLVLAGYA